MEAYPDILISKEPAQEKVTKIASIKGMAKKTAESFVQAIPNFIQFIQETGLTHKIHKVQQEEKAPKDPSNPLFGKSIVITGFRDKDLQEFIKKVGAKLGTSVSKNTFLVIVKDQDSKEEKTGKILDAQKLGIPIVTFDEFKSTSTF